MVSGFFFGRAYQEAKGVEPGLARAGFQREEYWDELVIRTELIPIAFNIYRVHGKAAQAEGGRSHCPGWGEKRGTTRFRIEVHDISGGSVSPRIIGHLELFLQES